MARLTREHILEVVSELFYWNGIRATGVDRVASEAGIAAPTLYRQFASKDELVAAYIERSDRLYREWLLRAADGGGDDPRARILAVFAALGEQIQPQRCRGCPFQMALAEFPDPELDAHRNAVTMKRWVRDRLAEMTEQLARTGAVADPIALADDLAVVLEGVYASAQALGASGPARRAQILAEALIHSAERG